MKEVGEKISTLLRCYPSGIHYLSKQAKEDTVIGGQCSLLSIFTLWYASFTTPKKMHELPITQSILDIALRHGKRENASRVSHIYLIIGELSSIVDESIQFYWDLISEGTICEGARLHFERIPARLHCLDCNESYTLANHELSLCPYCDSFNLQVTAGKEFRLEAIDIDT